MHAVYASYLPVCLEHLSSYLARLRPPWRCAARGPRHASAHVLADFIYTHMKSTLISALPFTYGRVRVVTRLTRTVNDPQLMKSTCPPDTFDLVLSACAPPVCLCTHPSQLKCSSDVNCHSPDCPASDPQASDSVPRRLSPHLIYQAEWLVPPNSCSHAQGKPEKISCLRTSAPALVQWTWPVRAERTRLLRPAGEWP